MKKFIDFCILFALYVTVTYINDDFNFNNKAGRIYYAAPSFVRSCLIWFVCPIFIPEYFIKQTKIYKQVKKVMDSPEYQAQFMKTFSMFKF
jgi:hypothetical protein